MTKDESQLQLQWIFRYRKFNNARVVYDLFNCFSSLSVPLNPALDQSILFINFFSNRLYTCSSNNKLSMSVIDYKSSVVYVKKDGYVFRLKPETQPGPSV